MLVRKNRRVRSTIDWKWLQYSILNFINWTEVSGLFFMRVDCMCMHRFDKTHRQTHYDYNTRGSISNAVQAIGRAIVSILLLLIFLLLWWKTYKNVFTFITTIPIWNEMYVRSVSVYANACYMDIDERHAHTHSHFGFKKPTISISNRFFLRLLLLLLLLRMPWW